MSTAENLDFMLQTVVQASTEPCWCGAEGGCESCGWTGVQIPNPHSFRVAAEALGACVAIMAESSQAGDEKTLRETLAWARKYISPFIDGIDLEAAQKDVLQKAERGRGLVARAEQGPAEPLSLEQLKDRLG